MGAQKRKVAVIYTPMILPYEAWHAPLNLAISGAYLIIAGSLIACIPKLPGNLRSPLIAFSAFIFCCGVGHGIEALTKESTLLIKWHFLTAGVSISAMIFSVSRIGRIVDFMNFGALILKHSPGRIALFRDAKNSKGERDLQWETCSDSAVRDIGFDPRTRQYMLAETQQGYNIYLAGSSKSLLQE